MSRKKGSRLSVRSRYRLTMAVLLLTMLAATLVSGTMNYQSQYADRLESARNDFETAWREVFSFMNRISGLAKIVQYNSSLVQMLEKTERYTLIARKVAGPSARQGDQGVDGRPGGRSRG